MGVLGEMGCDEGFPGIAGIVEKGSHGLVRVVLAVLVVSRENVDYQHTSQC